MRNENIFTMKQPALGKKISDLRKQQGLTQEELVEKCNINVRTIQRIEAGEVTPRSYTLKNILEVLGADFKSITENEVSENFTPILGITPVNKFKVLQLSWIFGIIYFFLGFPEIMSEYYRIEEGDAILTTTLYVLIKVASMISFFFFIRGFIATGKIYQKSMLSIVGMITLIGVFCFSVYDIISIYYAESWFLFMIWVRSAIYGVLLILLGISVLMLQKKYGALALITGIFEIISGIIFVFLIPELGIIILLPLQLLEIILLYKIAESHREIE